MALYSIESEQCLGMSHSGAVTVNGESAVELSDEEVDILVKLIKEKGTTDVEELDLENLHPAIYKKLDEAYYRMTFKGEEIHKLTEAFFGGRLVFDFYKLMDYSEKNLGFDLFIDPEDFFSKEDLAYYKEKPKEYNEIIDEAKSEAFLDWLVDYVYDLTDDEARDFFYNHMDADLDACGLQYAVKIPQAIINKAKG